MAKFPILQHFIPRFLMTEFVSHKNGPNKYSYCFQAGKPPFRTDIENIGLESLGLRYHEVVVPAALNMLIRGSGGVMRDFIRPIQSAALYAEVAGKERIGKAEAAKALNELRRQLMAQLTPEYHEVLNKVRQTRRRVGGAEEGEKCNLLLGNDVVLSYVGDDIWYDVHAALTEEPWRG
jgi:hypothetical protein